MAEKMKTIEKDIYKRGDGQYQVKIRKKGYPPVSKTFHALDLARDWRTTTLSDMIRGEFAPQVKLEDATLHDVLQRYADEVTTKKKGEKQELVRIKYLQKHKLAKRLIATITTDDIDDYIIERRAMPSKRNPKGTVADATIRLEVMLFSAVFEQAKRKGWKYVKANPVKELEQLPEKSKARKRRLEEGQEGKLFTELEKCRNDDIYRACRFALGTAARQSEIIGKESTSTRLKTDGVVWERLDLVHGTATLLDTKNGSDRIVPLPPDIIAMLKAMPRPIGGGKVFHCTQDGLIRAMQRATKAAGINVEGQEGESFTFHHFRHEATSRLVESGKFQMLEIMAITGHSSIEMAEIYTHVNAKLMAKRMATA